MIETEMAEWILTLVGHQQAMLGALRAVIASHPEPEQALRAWQEQRDKVLRPVADVADGANMQVDALRGMLQSFDADFRRRLARPPEASS